MKRRDLVLFGLPALILTLAILLACGLYLQVERFKGTYLAEVRANIAQEARLVIAAITPMLEAGNTAQAARFCGTFHEDTLRVTLIGEDGKVTADSQEDSDSLGNHQTREEVQAALAGQPASAVRYSETLHRWMMYHATAFTAGGKRYVLRTAVSTDDVSRLLRIFRLNLLCALVLGAALALALCVYIVRKVRRPLIDLQASVGDIAAGKLDTPIDIPADGIVHDLALGVAEMAEQLKRQLADMTAQRNERELLFETMDEGVLLFASDGALIRCNRAAARLFGLRSDDSASFRLSRCPIPELADAALGTLASGKGFEREFTSTQEQGARSFFVKAQLLPRQDSQHLLMTVTDLTGLRRLESFRSDFIANVSHEIKTPLTCIVGAVEALEDGAGPQQQTRLLAMLKMQSSRLNSLVADILTLSQLEREQADPERETEDVALDGVLANARNLCLARAEGAHMALDITHSEPLHLNGSAAQLEQALVNLIENAVRYSEGTRIGLSLARQGNDAILAVTDDGVGIAHEHQERIFERFYRPDKSRSRALGGTGLGLAIVKHIAQLHHGRAELESEPGKGCVFRLVLPLV